MPAFAQSIDARPKTAAGLLRELAAWNRDVLARLRGLRLWGPAARVGVAVDIGADLSGAVDRLARVAHSAETHDREALAKLDAVLADGRVTAPELAELRAARGLVARSAEQDHTIAEEATVTE